MAVNNPHGHNQYTDKKKIQNAEANKQAGTTSASSGTRGGTGEQHSDAGRQGHKSDDKSSQSGRQGQKSDG